jgi:hypothetical protein
VEGCLERRLHDLRVGLFLIKSKTGEVGRRCQLSDQRRRADLTPLVLLHCRRDLEDGRGGHDGERGPGASAWSLFTIATTSRTR